MSSQFFCQCVKRFSNLKSNLSPLLILFTVLIASVIGGCSSKCDVKCLEGKISEVKNTLEKFQQDRDQLQPKYESNSREYDKEYNYLKEKQQELGIKSHEELLRTCQNNYEACQSLERAAISQNTVNLLKNKIDKLDFQIADLSQKIWKLEKQKELKELNSIVDQKEVDELLVSTQVILQEQVTPSQAQDIGNLQKEIFEKIVNENSSSSAKYP